MNSARLIRSFLSVACVALLAACTQQPAQAPTPPDTRAADEAAIRAAATEWGKAAAARDLEKTLTFYADDASMFPPNMPIATGAEARRKVWTELLAPPDLAFSITTTMVEVARSGDIAFETGNFEDSFNDKKGKQMKIVGKYVVVWKKHASGQWKAAADIFNSDN